jgi:RNA polymerase sigma-70 factor (ECF subfamily)
VADKRIQAALAALPNDFRVAVYYIDVQGYTYAETAAMLNLPHGTVMSRLARGRKRLRVALAHVAANRGNFAVVERRIA